MSDEAKEADSPDSPDGAASDDGRTRNASDGDATVPKVDLSLQELSVSVAGRSDGDLGAVEESALTLTEALVETAETLEEDRDEYGLS